MPDLRRAIVTTARTFALLGCLVLLTGWRFGPPLTFFDEDGGIQRGVADLARAGGFTRVISIDIAPSRIEVQAEDPNDPRKIKSWVLTKHNIRSFNWEEIDGPRAVEMNLKDADLDANLFDLSEIDLTAAQVVMQEALARAELEDPGHVESMDIRRTLHIFPRLSSGDVAWMVRVRSPRESALMFADGKGRFVRMDLDGTNRAKAFDLLASLDRLDEAAQAFARTVGATPVLVEVRIDKHGATFETNMKETATPFDSLKQNQIFHWNLNGLLARPGSIDTSSAIGAKPTFAVSDVNWRVAGSLVAQARDHLEMPDAALDDIEVEKPGDVAGAPKPEWQITFRDQNGEDGTARYDAGTGVLLGVVLPKSRRKPFDARDPAVWPALLAQIEQAFGAEGSLAELTINDTEIAITASDPRNPNELADFLLDEDGIRRFGSVSPFTAENPRFTVAEIRALTGEQMAKLIAATIARLGLPSSNIVNITIGKASMDPSPQGNVTVEIRAEEAPFKRSGRVNWEIDGREIKAYLP